MAEQEEEEVEAVVAAQRRWRERRASTEAGDSLGMSTGAELELDGAPLCRGCPGQRPPSETPYSHHCTRSVRPFVHLSVGEGSHWQAHRTDRLHTYP